MTRIVVFGFDAAESSQIRRIRSLIDAGYDVVAFTMRRSNMSQVQAPAWNNIHLFDVPNEQIFRRLWILARSVLKIARHRAVLRRADLLIARNFDMLLLAHSGRLLALRPRLPVVYECLDIHSSFTSTSIKGRVFRSIERMLLRRTQLLVVSSPGFVGNYFSPVQHYSGKTHLLENKIWFGAGLPRRRESAQNISGGRPWVLGWVGTLRCEPSFRILLETARRMGDRVRIEMHGIVHHHALPDFEKRIRDQPNIAFHGPYAYPDGLASVYAGCDLVWAQDLWQSGANSDWLLPNRIYEASYFGCLSIAVSTTQTGRKVEADDLGYTIPEPSAAALVALLENLGPAEVETRRAALLARDPRAFVYASDDIRAMVEDALAAS